MKKILLFLLVCLLCASASQAQTTAVSGTIQDVNGQAFLNGTWTVQLYPGTGGQYYVNGRQLLPSDVLKTGNLDTGGNISVSVYENNVITPPGTQWVFVLCPASPASCYTSAPITLTTPTFNLGSTLNAIPAISVKSGQLVNAYADSEVTGTGEGAHYWNVTNALQRVFHNGAWINGGGGSSSVAFNQLTAGINSNAGSFGFNGNTFDLSLATGFLVPQTTSCSASATNDFALDTTNNNAVFYNDLTCLINLGIASGAVNNSGDVASLILNGNSVTVSDAGAPNGHAGLNPVFMQGVSGMSNTNGDYFGVDATGKWNELTPGFVLQLVASPLTMSSAERGHLLQLTGGSAQTASVAGPSQPGFGLSYYNEVWPSGAGNLTITPGNGATITGGCNNVSAGASAVVDAGAIAQLISDNTNYFLPCFSTPFSTSTFTNKTFDTGGTGNVFKVNGSGQITAAQGNGAKLQLSTGTTTTNDCVKFDANGNTVDSGGACAGAPAWSSITNPSGNLALTMGTDTSTFNFSSNLAAAFSFLNTTAATSGANQSGPQGCFGGQYWTGSVSAADSFCIADVLAASGANPVATLTFSHSGTTGNLAYQFGSWSMNGGTGSLQYAGGAGSAMTISTASANETITINPGASSSGTAAGLLLLEGGNNSSTGNAGSAVLQAGGNSSTGADGLVRAISEWAKGTTVTAGNLQCASADNTTADCGASPLNVTGIATGTVTASPISVVVAGEALVNVSSAAAVGNNICAGTTAGQGTPQAGACAIGTLIGRVKSITLNGSSSTEPLVELHFN